MENRICKDCKLELLITEFYKNGKFHKTSCKSCDKEKSANYKLNNLEKVRENYRDYGRRNKEKRESYSVDYYKSNRDEILVKQKEYWSKQQNKERKALRKREQWQRDENLKIVSNCRSRMYKALKGQKKSKSTEKLVGCLFSELKVYLESRFIEGMNWGKREWNKHQGGKFQGNNDNGYIARLDDVIGFDMERELSKDLTMIFIGATNFHEAIRTRLTVLRLKFV